MSFKEQGWIPYGKRANSVDILVKDTNGNTIESFKVYHGQGQFEKNQRIFNPRKVIRILKEKYGFNFEVKRDERFMCKDIELPK